MSEEKYTPEQVAMQRKEMGYATAEMFRVLAHNAVVFSSIDSDKVDPKVLEELAPLYLELACFLSEVSRTVGAIKELMKA